METTMTNQLVIERTYDAPIHKVWQALTDKEKMKQWYFDIPEFKPEVDSVFTFKAGPAEKKYLHECKVTEIIPNKKISYTWYYPGYEGQSEVSFELSGQDGKTHLTLTHKGLETFDQVEFPKENFNCGWEYFGGALGDFLKK